MGFWSYVVAGDLQKSPSVFDNSTRGPIFKWLLCKNDSFLHKGPCSFYYSTCDHRTGKRRRLVGGLGGGADGSRPTGRWQPEGRASSKAADECVLLSVVLLPTAGQARGDSWLVVWAADTPAPAWIQRRGGWIEAEEHEADGEAVGRRRGELQGGGVVPWRFPSL